MASVLVLAPDPDCDASSDVISAVCAHAIIKALKRSPAIATCKKVSVACLSQQLPTADLLVIGGGECAGMRDLLKPLAPEIQAWMSQGGGLIGICAGAVLASSDNRRGLKLCQGVRLCEDNLAAVAGLCGLVEVQFADTGRSCQPDIPSTAAPSPSSQSSCAGRDSCHMNSCEKEVSLHFLDGEKRCLHYENGPVMRSTSRCAVPFAAYVGFALDSNDGSAAAGDDAKEDPTRRKSQRKGVSQGWECGECGASHKASCKKCACGAKRQQQKRGALMREKLASRMAGKVAVMGVTAGISRAVLFGPHPELSSKQGGWELLLHAVEWVCPQTCTQSQRRGAGEPPQKSPSKRPSRTVSSSSSSTASSESSSCNSDTSCDSSSQPLHDRD